MKGKQNIVILSGTKNCDPFLISKKKEYKQYLLLNGKPVVSYVIDAALSAKCVNKIFIIADPAKMRKVLSFYSSHQRARIHVVENQESLLQSIFFCFTEYTQTGVLLPSDAPFLTSKSIDAFIGKIPDTADYVIGFTNGRKLDAIFSKAALFVKKEAIKYGLFPIHDAQIRISNLHYLDFTHVSSLEQKLASSVFENRKLLDEHGRKNRKSWRRIAGACLLYIHQRHYHPAILLGAVLTGFAAFCFYVAHKTRHSMFEKIYAFPLRPAFFSFVLTLLTGYKLTCVALVTEDLAPMLDIDVVETYLLLTKNNHFEELCALLR